MRRQPLADRLRPTDFSEIAGQKHLFGSNGSIFLRGAMGTLTVCRADGKTAPVWMTPQIRHEPIGINHHEAFADVIINDKKEKPGASDGIACIKVVEEIYRKAAK